MGSRSGLGRLEDSHVVMYNRMHLVTICLRMTNPVIILLCHSALRMETLGGCQDILL